jgi:hypothetical protein
MTIDFGLFRATYPRTGRSAKTRTTLTVIYPPDGDAAIQISTYRGPDGHLPTPEELWDFAEPFDPDWKVDRASIRRDRGGYALDAEGPAEIGGALLAYRLWPGQLVFATFYYSEDAARHLEVARALLSSLEPSDDIAPR